MYPKILALPLPVLATAPVLLFLFLAFIVFFLIPAVRRLFLLRAIQDKLRRLTGSNADELKKIFAVDSRLAHLWNQYQETLHEQTEDHNGQTRVMAVRSTVPAEAYFNSQYIVRAAGKSHSGGQVEIERIPAGWNRLKPAPDLFPMLQLKGSFSGFVSCPAKPRVAESSTAVNSLMHFWIAPVIVYPENCPRDHRSARPGRASVGRPSFMTAAPFTKTCLIPCESAPGS